MNDWAGTGIPEREYEIVRCLVYDRSRINLGSDKRELVTARLGKRLRALGLASYREYCDLITSPAGADEVANLVDVISTNHTFFFRESKHFEYLADSILPAWFASHEGRGATFRVWSAACSSGEEPYSIAVLLAESFRNLQGLAWTIEATDISTRILERARQGVFDADRLREVRPDWLRAHFQRGVNKWEGSYRVKAALRDKVHFTHLNLLGDSPYPFQEPFDLIFCRNVMIYFDRPTQETLVGRLAERLLPKGHLYVGHSESLTGLRHGLDTVMPAIYRKR